MSAISGYGPRVIYHQSARDWNEYSQPDYLTKVPHFDISQVISVEEIVSNALARAGGYEETDQSGVLENVLAKVIDAAMKHGVVEETITSAWCWAQQSIHDTQTELSHEAKIRSSYTSRFAYSPYAQTTSSSGGNPYRARQTDNSVILIADQPIHSVVSTVDDVETATSIYDDRRKNRCYGDFGGWVSLEGDESSSLESCRTEKPTSLPRLSVSSQLHGEKARITDAPSSPAKRRAPQDAPQRSSKSRRMIVVGSGYLNGHTLSNKSLGTRAKQDLRASRDG